MPPCMITAQVIKMLCGVRDRPVALIGAEMRQSRAKCLAPQHRVAAVARMTEIESVGHLRNELPDRFGIAAIAVAGEDQCLAADPFSRAVAAHDVDAADKAVGSASSRSATRSDMKMHIVCLRGMCADGRSVPARAARQSVHAAEPNGRGN